MNTPSCTCLDLPSRHAALKSFLTPHHKKNHVAFNEKHVTWLQDKVHAILWSNECIFTVTGTPSRTVCRFRSADCYDTKFFVKHVRHPDTLMVWGAFSDYSVGNSVFCWKSVTLNAERYLDLYDNLEECYDKCKAEALMQHGTPCHRSKPVNEWLENRALNLFQDWPANSPNLNPTENVWSLMKRKLREKDTSSIPKLKAALLAAWNNMSEDTLQALADSFPQRLYQVITRKGNPIKY